MFKNIRKFPWLLFLPAIVYIVYCLLFNKNLFVHSDLNYYNYFISALLHKRLDLIIDFRHDLSFFNNKWYMYWGPAPIFYVLPFVIFGRIQTSDVFYTLVAGIANIFIFYCVAKELIKYFQLKISQLSFWVIILGFGLVSPNFYLSLVGQIWHTNQVVAIFYLLFFLFFFFKYLNQKKMRYFWLALIFINLAWLSRYTLVFYYLFFLLLFKEKKQKLLIWTALVFFGSLLIFFSYNYARFGSILETGFRFQRGSLRYDYFFKHNQLFSLTNIPYNFYYYFLHHFSLRLVPFKLTFNPEGNSVFLIYPLLVFNFLWFKKKFKQKKIIFFRNIAIGVTFFTLAVLLSNIGTGWVQFGNRYFFDLIPLLYLSIFFVIKSVPIWLQWGTLIYGVIINAAGIWIFHQR